MKRFLRQLFCLHHWRNGWPDPFSEPRDAKTAYCVKCDKRAVVKFSDLFSDL